MHSVLAWGAPEYVLKREQWVPHPMETVFPFFEAPHNLAKITPPWLGFHVIAMAPNTIQRGTLVTYRLLWLGIPYRWRTRIEAWEPNTQFVDTMLSGPYIFWRHTHTFEECAGGVYLTDRVRYRLPFGPLGILLHALVVRRQLDRIFDYRVEKIATLLADGQVYARPPKA